MVDSRLDGALLDGEPGAAALAALTEDAEALLAVAQLDDVELSLVLCDDPFIQSLNRDWRAKDAPTDVLSFPQDDEVVIGDLVISLDTAARQGAERGHSTRDELRILLVHGLLHLLGYDHEADDADLLEMAEAEGRLMGRLGWVGQGLIERVGLPDAGASGDDADPT